MSGLVKCLFLVSLAVTAWSHSLGPNDVMFHLFTLDNLSASQPLLPTVGSISVSSYRISQPTVFIIHTNGDFSNFWAHMVNAHLGAADVNLIAVDWSRGATMYSQGVAVAPQAGRVVAQFINILIGTFGIPVSNFRIVGVGLGGHVAAIAARATQGVIPHIIALDPSLHGWTHHPERLGPDAAALVEVIHTTAGVLGYDRPLGHIDFYPNGGVNQNGCGLDSSCSLTLAYAFYAESILAEVNNANRFVGTRCDSYEEALVMSCSGPRDAFFGGLAAKTGANGIYTFTTNPQSPFAQN